MYFDNQRLSLKNFGFVRSRRRSPGGPLLKLSQIETPQKKYYYNRWIHVMVERLVKIFIFDQMASSKIFLEKIHFKVLEISKLLSKIVFGHYLKIIFLWKSCAKFQVVQRNCAHRTCSDIVSRKMLLSLWRIFSRICVFDISKNTTMYIFKYTGWFHQLRWTFFLVMVTIWKNIF